MTIVLIVFCALLMTLRMWQRKYNPDPEWVRKLFHLGMGVFSLTLPYLFPTTWPVVGMCVVTVALLIALRASQKLRARFGAVLGGVARHSHGEVYFSVGVAALFVLAKDDHLTYLIAILLLTFADTAAALVGKRFGTHRLGQKSLAGSLAFLTVAIVCIYVPLVLAGQADIVAVLLLTLSVALLLTLIEAFATRGLDNLFIPLAAYLLLHGLPEQIIDRLNTALIGAALITAAFSLATGVHRFKKRRKGFIA